MARTSQKMLEDALTRLCEALGMARGDGSLKVGAFLDDDGGTPAHWGIKYRNPDSSVSDPFGSTMRPASALWDCMSFMLAGLGAGTLKADADAARNAREELWPNGNFDLESEWDGDTIEHVAGALDPRKF